MKELGLVALGGALGSVLRYKSSIWAAALYPTATFPIGTFFVNLLGCFGIGLFSALFEKYGLADPRLKLLLITGFLGGFTTFSAFSVETLELFRRGATLMALFYVACSVLLGAGSTLLGFLLIPSKTIGQ